VNFNGIEQLHMITQTSVLVTS